LDLLRDLLYFNVKHTVSERGEEQTFPDVITQIFDLKKLANLRSFHRHELAEPAVLLSVNGGL